MILSRPKKSKKILFLIPLLVLFLFAGFIWIKFERTDIGFGFFNFRDEGIISPILPPGEEERLQHLLEQEGIEVEKVKLVDGSLEVRLPGNLSVYFPQGENYSSKVASLQFILQRFKIEGKMPVKIDLRFTKPVLTY